MQLWPATPTHSLPAKNGRALSCYSTARLSTAGRGTPECGGWTTGRSSDRATTTVPSTILFSSTRRLIPTSSSRRRSNCGTATAAFSSAASCCRIGLYTGIRPIFRSPGSARRGVTSTKKRAAGGVSCRLQAWAGKKRKTLCGLKDWNQYEIYAKGSHIRLTLNGVVTIDTHDDKASSGVIGFQLHTGVPMEVRFRGIKVKPLIQP